MYGDRLDSKDECGDSWLFPPQEGKITPLQQGNAPGGSQHVSGDSRHFRKLVATRLLWCWPPRPCRRVRVATSEGAHVWPSLEAFRQNLFLLESSGELLWKDLSTNLNNTNCLYNFYQKAILLPEILDQVMLHPAQICLMIARPKKLKTVERREIPPVNVHLMLLSCFKEPSLMDW